MKKNTPNFIKQGDEYLMNMPATILLVAGWLHERNPKAKAKANIFISHVIAVARNNGFKSHEEFYKAFRWSLFPNHKNQTYQVTELCKFISHEEILEALNNLTTEERVH